MVGKRIGQDGHATPVPDRSVQRLDSKHKLFGDLELSLNRQILRTQTGRNDRRVAPAVAETRNLIDRHPAQLALELNLLVFIALHDRVRVSHFDFG
jgi:hypothetical protein